MTTKEVAQKLVALCKKGQFAQARKELFHPHAASIESMEGPQKEVHGLEEIEKKSKEWENMVEQVHKVDVSEPLVAEDHFAVRFDMDITYKGQPRRHDVELAVYEVKDGKISKEQFFYPPMPMPS